jgi:hypothetical protein
MAAAGVRTGTGRGRVVAGADSDIASGSSDQDHTRAGARELM